ncbi:MAG TPA: tRNA glutamyl-Q(34) synthetase GluQRS [Gaiellales bacterium]|nr:tRNA glutamyl-Q(34) synthetase GluQRS [Gaiellales bacterium]
MVVGRFAPSPSGLMHLGNARTALLAWLDVRSRGGRMLLRVDDLDRERCRPAWAAAIRDDLRWLGLDWDQETAPQSTRDGAYREALEQLTRAGHAYGCHCTRRDLALASAPHARGRRYPGTCARLSAAERDARAAAGRRPAVRVRMPAAPVAVRDRLHGELVESVAEVTGDIVCRRSDGLFAYQLAVVVDDAADGVTDVVRGVDLLASTPRQVALAGLLEVAVPAHGHVPLALGPDGARLSKRHGPIALADLRAAGVGPEALVGALAASAGLAEPGARVMPAALLSGFRLEHVGRAPVFLDGRSLLRVAS